MKKALIGAGGHASEINAVMGTNLPMFVDDEYYINAPGVMKLSNFDPNEYEVMIAIGDSNTRFNIYNKLPKETIFFSFVHPTSLIFGNVLIGNGSYIGPYCILTTSIKIGDHSILNRGNQIGHDCLIGDFFSAMPGSIISGNVQIGNRVYIGSNSTIIENKSVVSGVIIGAGSCVVKSIKEIGVYAGCPTKKIRK